MIEAIGLEGSWSLQLDESKKGLVRPFTDAMALPGTTSFARKGRKNEEALVGSLTDEYKSKAARGSNGKSKFRSICGIRSVSCIWSARASRRYGSTGAKSVRGTA